MLKYLSFLVVLLCFASCQDKQSSSDKKAAKPSKEALAEQRKQDSIQRYRDSLVAARKKELEKKNEKTLVEQNTDFPIVQEELMPYMREYFKNNPERKVRIKTRFGNIDVQLYNDTPLHTANFIMLVKNEYFNYTYFHRVAPGFVIQGGNADSQEVASMRADVGDYLIPSEFEAGHSHTYGAFAAAKYAEQNVSKASSPFEFYIVMNRNGTPHLNNDHTVFGRVISGMDVAEKIAEQETGDSEWPRRDIEMDIEIID